MRSITETRYPGSVGPVCRRSANRARARVMRAGPAPIVRRALARSPARDRARGLLPCSQGVVGRRPQPRSSSQDRKLGPVLADRTELRRPVTRRRPAPAPRQRAGDRKLQEAEGGAAGPSTSDRADAGERVPRRVGLLHVEPQGLDGSHQPEDEARDPEVIVVHERKARQEHHVVGREPASDGLLDRLVGGRRFVVVVRELEPHRPDAQDRARAGVLLAPYARRRSRGEEAAEPVAVVGGRLGVGRARQHRDDVDGGSAPGRDAHGRAEREDGVVKVR